MSKKSNGRSASTIVDANIQLFQLLRPPVPRPVVMPPLVYNDERFYSPLRRPVAVAPGGRPATLKPSPSGTFRRGIVSFVSPQRVDTCQRRKTRRQVIFALNKASKGAQSKYRKRNQLSGISCK